MSDALLACYYILNNPASEEETKMRVEEQCNALERMVDPEQKMLLQKQAAKKTFAEIVDIASQAL